MRTLVVPELRKIQTIPEGYILKVTEFKDVRDRKTKRMQLKETSDFEKKNEKVRQIGNGVPVLLAKSVALHCLEILSAIADARAQPPRKRQKR